MTATISIVTGSAQGIGKAIALRLAADGCDLVVNDLESKSKELSEVVGLIQQLGRKCIAVYGDASDEMDVIRLVETAVNELGGLDVMVANAGIYQGKSILKTSVADWDRVMSINTRSVFLAYKHASAAMIAQGRGGRIIGASSLAGKKGAANAPAYCASKFAVRGLTQATAAELSSHKITVNAYAPGFIVTPMMIEAAEALKQSGQDFADVGMPATALGAPEDVASLVSYWASEASGFVTGQTWVVDGGTFYD